MEKYIAIIATLIAIMVAWTGYQQYKLAKDKFKLDLFEKRFAVYKGIQRFLTIIRQKPYFDDGQLFEFRRDTQNATFLFGSEITKYINMIDSKALKMRSIVCQYQPLPVGKDRSILVKNQDQLLTELIDELPRLREVFAPYLRFEKWK